MDLVVQNGALLKKGNSLGTGQACCCGKCSGPCPTGVGDCAPGCGCKNSECVPCSGPCDEANPCPEGCECVEGTCRGGCLGRPCGVGNPCPEGCGVCCNGACSACELGTFEIAGEPFPKSPCASFLCFAGLVVDKDLVMQQLREHADAIEAWVEENGYTLCDKTVGDDPTEFQTHCFGSQPQLDFGEWVLPCRGQTGGQDFGEDVPTYWGNDFWVNVSFGCCGNKNVVVGGELSQRPEMPIELSYVANYVHYGPLHPCEENPLP